MSATTETIVTLYRTTCTTASLASTELGTGYSLTSWTNGSIAYDGDDDGGQAYVLPAGYEVAESVDGAPGIFEVGPRGEACELLTSRSGRPALLLPSCDVVELRSAEA